MKRFNELDMLIPISLDIDWPESKNVISDIIEQHEKFGFTRFMLCCPGAGWRGIGYPPHEFFIERAERFKEIKEALTAIRSEARSAAAEAAKPKMAVNCPFCGASVVPDASGKCEYCGGAIG